MTGPHPGRPAPEWYTSAELLDIERRRVFDSCWALVGTVEEVAQPGSYVTATVGTSPLIVARDHDGDLRAVHNLCRHRGLPVLEPTHGGAGECGRFLTCPYHQWSYDLTGALRRVPQAEDQFANVDPGAWGLLEAQAATWHGMVFANPDPDARSLDESLGFLDERLSGFLSGPLVEVAKVEYTARCNWKLLVENHIDVYHLWFVHSRSLSMYQHRQFEWNWEGGNWWSLEPLKDPAPAAHAPLGWLTSREKQSIGAHLLFPNVMMAHTGEYFATYDATPLGPDTTKLVLRIRSTVDADGDALIEAVRSFLAEDLAVCELLQQGVGSSRFRAGPLAATHEAPIRAFHATLASRCGS
jgi:Rieske 2Fe-2S family protein